MGFSHGYGAVPDEAYSIDAIRKAYDFGCTFFDTAEGYGKEMFYAGHNEQLVGKAIEPFRNKVILAKILEQKNATSAQISLAWMLQKYPNVVPIPGSKNQERIIENLGAWHVDLTDEEFESLKAALDACTVHGHRGHVESEQTSFGNKWKNN